MSSRESVQPAPLGSITIFQVVAVFERAVAAAVAWRNARGTERELMKLSDQQLADIGLHRGAIPEVADYLAHA